MKRWLVVLWLIVTAAPLLAQNGVWQWAVPVRNWAQKPKSLSSQAYLWIPPTCQQVKAVLVAQHNMEEIALLEDADFRARMEELGVAQIWVHPSFNHGFDFRDGAWETLDALLQDLATVSGYDEIATAPLIPIGHSAAASWPYYLAAYKPDRVLACISVSGQWPYHRDTWLCHDSWGDRTIDRIPCLETMGEYESAESWALRGLKERQEHPLLPLSMLACPAEGHFAYTPEKAQYIALYIRKALQYGHVDPTQQGWLVERWRRNQEPTVEAAPVAAYQGDRAQAFWYFDQEMAEATLAYGARWRHKLPQLAALRQQGELVPQRNTHMQLHPQCRTEADGVTIALEATMYDRVPAGHDRLPAWTQKSVGDTIGCGTGKAYLRMISGPAEVVEGVGLRIAWNRLVLWDMKQVELDFAVEHAGDDMYKPAVQQARILMPIHRTEGVGQQIYFAPLKDISPRKRCVQLQATASSGLPVGFYVECGPARIEGDKLYLTQLPPRTKFPVRVTVVAWQYGRTGEKAVATAEPVRQTFYIR